MAVMVLGIGVDPKPLTDGIDATAVQTVQTIEQHRLSANDPDNSEIAGRWHGGAVGRAALTGKAKQPSV